MNLITKKKIEEIQKQTGHILSVSDFDLIEELNALGDVVSGTTKTEARLLSEPFSLCGLLFYPITVAKSLWYDEMCNEWEIEGSQQEALLFWLLSVPNITGALDKYSGRKEADKAIKKLSRRLHCSTEELTEVYHKCVGIKSSGEKSNEGFGGLIECLLREYGGNPDKWLYETPLPVIETLMTQHTARINREAAAANKQPGSKAVAPVADERLRALKNFREKSNELKEHWENDG